MQIRAFAGRAIHGYLNLQIRFRSGVTFLTGINGTGKTSIVRCIVALLQPSLPYLLETEFRELRVSVIHNKRLLRVWATKSDRQLTIGHGKSRAFLKIRILKQDEFETPGRFRERWNEFITVTENEYATHPVLQYLRDLPTPMFLGLERRSEAETTEDRPARVVSRRFRGLIGGNLYDSLIQARGLAENAFREVLAQVGAITDELRQNLILSAFSLSDVSTRFARPVFPAKTPAIGYIEKLREKREVVMRAFETLGIEPKLVHRTVRPFFERLERAGSRLPKSKPLFELMQREGTLRLRSAVMDWVSLRPQEERIDQLYAFVKKYSRQVEIVRAHIDQYLAAANSFMADSSKSLIFLPSGNLRVQVKSIGERPITALSSGESHLFVILTHLYFNPRRELASVLIIDEPELSLHIKWQEMFVDAVTGAKPDLQLILATHSPSIILDRERNCIDLEQK